MIVGGKEGVNLGESHQGTWGTGDLHGRTGVRAGGTRKGAFVSMTEPRGPYSALPNARFAFPPPQPLERPEPSKAV